MFFIVWLFYYAKSLQAESEWSHTGITLESEWSHGILILDKKQKDKNHKTLTVNRLKNWNERKFRIY